ncbi:Glycosyl hydrolases 36 [Trichophyton rubrum]|nr:Glycosyl hydrolases 36 [Trichophyton rubrum]
MCLPSNITSWPPLGQLTFIHRKRGAQDNIHATNNLSFTVVLESDHHFPEQSYEVVVWHNICSDAWTGLELKSSPDSQLTVISDNTSSRCFRKAFVGEIPLPTERNHAEFTIKYKPRADCAWQWANETFKAKNGEIIIEPMKPLSNDNTYSLQNYLHSINNNIDVKPGRSDAAGALLWNISCQIEPAVNGESKTSRILLGTPKDYVRTFSLVRASASWLAPRQGTTSYNLNEDALVSSFVYRDGIVMVLVSVSGIDDVLTVFQSGKEGELIISSRNDNNRAAKSDAVAAIASSFEIAMAAAIYEARKKSQNYSVALQHIYPADNDQEPAHTGVANGPTLKWQPEWYDGLSYCTWNALGQDLTEQNILNALQSLKKNGIQISSLIIDDGWQSLDNEGQSQFERGITRFEASQVGFPHGLQQTIAKIRKENERIKHVSVWHALLGYWGGISPAGEIASKYNTIEVERTGQLSSSKIKIVDPDDLPSFYDDFYTFLSSADWDMFQTSHSYASFHAAARCVSGGVIYITDEPGKHNLAIINQMTALTTRGDTVILRPSVAGHKSGNVTKPMHQDDTHAMVLVTLKPRDYDILTVYPVYAFDVPKKSKPCAAGTKSRRKVSVLGLLDKMTGAAAIIGSDISMDSGNDLRFNVTLKALGTLGLWISDLAERSITDNFMVLIHGLPVPVETVQRGIDREGCILSIDVLTAWKKMGLDSGRSNEVVVQVLMM